MMTMMMMIYDDDTRDEKLTVNFQLDRLGHRLWTKAIVGKASVHSAHVPCDFVDGEDAPMALQSLLLPLPSPFQGWLGAAALNPATQRDTRSSNSNERFLGSCRDHRRSSYSDCVGQLCGVEG